MGKSLSNKYLLFENASATGTANHQYPCLRFI